jgi:hypothetical protein
VEEQFFLGYGLSLAEWAMMANLKIVDRHPNQYDVKTRKEGSE